MAILKQLPHKQTSIAYTGTYTPMLHRLMDAEPKIHAQHRLGTHNFSFVKLVENLYGEQMAKEVLVHIMVDRRIIRKYA